ncbi:phosphodiesterase [Skermania sp. ID1734]|uniref:phosphodiesterase n=1 Tax=Skermania sp. ID1734 TaxID=2597516 RepID=UPI00117F79AC|nr:phosphodiesterase [Skermania sp. ID1734]TSD97256.1 phosphodiesterase [Skermania sp. ID1734]
MIDLPARAFAGTFNAVARLRHARVFHPHGVALAGRLRATGEFEQLVGSGDRPLVARLSKATSTPGALPDFLGLALRVLDRNDQPWDFTFVTTGTSRLGRFVLIPSNDWSSATFGSLMPYRLGEDPAPKWLFAQPDAGLPSAAGLGELRNLAHDHQLEFTLTARGFGGEPIVLAGFALAATEQVEHTHPGFFDPVRNHPDDVALLPEAISRIRELAYSGSRHGRGQPAG